MRRTLSTFSGKRGRPRKNPTVLPTSPPTTTPSQSNDLAALVASAAKAAASAADTCAKLAQENAKLVQLVTTAIAALSKPVAHTPGNDLDDSRRDLPSATPVSMINVQRPSAIDGVSPCCTAFAFQIPPTNARSGRAFAAADRKLLEYYSFSQLGRRPRDSRWLESRYAVDAVTQLLLGGEDGARVAASNLGAAKVAAEATVAACPIRVELPAPSAVVTINGHITAGTVSRTFVPVAFLHATLPKGVTFEAFSARLLDEAKQPRCGHTGAFFEGEGIVDALTNEAAKRRFSQNYWISPAHPKIQSGYLKLQPNAEPVTVTHQGVVFPATRLLSRRGAENQLHASYSEKGLRKPGMNIFTGEVCNNPFFRTHPAFEGGNVGWFSLQQVLQRGHAVRAATEAELALAIDAKRENPSASQKLLSSIFDGGTTIDLLEHVLYNSTQLERSGRLGRVAGDAVPCDANDVPDPDADGDGRLFR